MKALFNGHCFGCEQFRPRCTTVILTGWYGADVELPKRTLCEECRKVMRGQFRLHSKHKKEKEK